MRRIAAVFTLAIIFAVATSTAQQPASNGPYKVLKAARVGGEGNWDYIYADAAGRRLYIPRRGGAPPGTTDPAAALTPIPTRLTIFDLDTLEPAVQIDGVGGNGTAVDPKSGHGFTSSKPVSMFDTKTMKLIKTIDVGDAAPDGIVFDSPIKSVIYIFSHPTKNATVNRRPGRRSAGPRLIWAAYRRRACPTAEAMLYVVMQDAQGSVTAVDVKTMEAIAHYPFGDKGGCNGLALDARNRVLFAACSRSGNPPADPPQPMMVILSAVDGKILTTLPLAGGSDGEMFNPATMEAYSTQGNGTLTVVKESSPTNFEVEQNLQTMNGARTIAFDSGTNHIFTMSDERGPAPPTPPGGGRPARGAAIPGSFTILMIGK